MICLRHQHPFPHTLIFYHQIQLWYPTTSPRHRMTSTLLDPKQLLLALKLGKKGRKKNQPLSNVLPTLNSEEPVPKKQSYGPRRSTTKKLATVFNAIRDANEMFFQCLNLERWPRWPALRNSRNLFFLFLWPWPQQDLHRRGHSIFLQVGSCVVL